jgi:hypothetical protein
MRARELPRINARMTLNKEGILVALKAAGIALVTGNYSGSGDNGQIDHVLAFGPNSENGPGPEIALPDAKVRLIVQSLSNLFGTRQTFSLREAIEYVCWMLLEYLVADVDGEGTFTFDVASDGIWSTDTGGEQDGTSLSPCLVLGEEVGRTPPHLHPPV